MYTSIDNYNKIDSRYLGYIEYLNVKVEIVLGINDENLNSNHACLDLDSQSLSSGNKLIIAGHSIDSVFNKLHYLKINDTIKIVTSKMEYQYKVSKIMSVDEYDLDAINKDYDLTLITCLLNPHKRLIIKASINN